jgi:hypothetical protein
MRFVVGADVMTAMMGNAPAKSVDHRKIACANPLLNLHRESASFQGPPRGMDFRWDSSIIH